MPPSGSSPNSSNSSAPFNSTREGLDHLRNRLLDLTKRNKLLNFRHSSKSSLRVVDELPDQLFKHLKDETNLVFRPVPEPKPEKKNQTNEKLPSLPLLTETSPEETEERPHSRKISAKEYAAQLGIRSSYDLPDPGPGENPRHFDKFIQTLQYPDELEATLRRISSSARTALEESGTNMLYLVFGFLEWYESAESSEPLYSPLLSLPVELTRIQPSRTFGGMFEFSIEYTGEDLLTNLSLVERMKQDFALSIPLLDEGDTPESYFNRFEEILKPQPRWRIRRQITLTLLHFGKLLMFLDLDPTRYPALLAHPRVKELLEGHSQKEDLSYDEVFDLDHSSIAQELPPIIYDADSSQHSALIDALRGRNLVIEGPPGTGKSQTITNLIAAALVKGKSVLFVSEKLAALEVVRRRLDLAGLGHFCLELHSHKTKKDKFFQDIHQRIRQQRPFHEPLDLQDKIKLLGRNKQELVQYVHLINKPFGALRKTIFDIIWTRDILLQKHPFLENFNDRLALAHPDQLNPSEQEHQSLLVEIYEKQLAAILERFPSVTTHPWAGIRNISLSHRQEREALDKLDAVKERMVKLTSSARALSSMTGVSLVSSFRMLQRFCEMRPLLPHIDGSEQVALIPRLASLVARNTVEQFLDGLRSRKRKADDLQRHFTATPSIDDPARDELKKALSELKSLNISRRNQAELEKLAVQTKDLQGSLEKALPFCEQIVQKLRIEYPITLESLRHFSGVLEILRQTNFDVLRYRDPVIGNSLYDRTRASAQTEAQAVGHLRSLLSQKYILGRLPSTDELWKHSSTVSSSSFLGRLFNTDYKTARNFYRSVRKESTNVHWSVMAVELKMLAEFQDRENSFNSNVQYQEAFGSSFRGLTTPFEELGQLQAWYTDLNAKLSPHLPIAQSLIDALKSVSVDTLRTLSAYVQQQASAVELLELLPIQIDSLSIDLRPPGGFRDNIEIDRLALEVGNMADLLERAVDCISSVPFREHIIAEDMPSLLEQVAVLQIIEQSLDHDTEVAALLEDYYQGCQTDQRVLEATLNIARKATHKSIPPDIQNWLLGGEFAERVHELDQQLQNLNNVLSQYSALWDVFVEFVDLDPQQWYAETGGEWQDFSLDLICSRIDRALNNPLALSDWLEYIRSRKGLEEVHLGTIVSLSEQGQLLPSHLVAAYRFAIYNGLSSLILNIHPTLMNFSRGRHEKIREQFMKLDTEIVELYRKQAAHEISQREISTGNGTGPVREWTDLKLIQHEIQRQRGHIPIRSLINRANQALLGLKPCFMMGPLSVAQYLQPGKFYFDLIIMDEASQLKPEDALGAIARGSQMIVVGDPKQLPPTSFFDTMFTELNGAVDEDDGLAIEESESILDRACEVYQPIRRLRWHYRSRHESLIAFSNHNFYDQNLILFPSPKKNSSELGIKYHFVQEGVYSGRTNRLEAERIIKAVLDHMANHPNESLGVATFNSTQRELIEELLDAQAKKDPLVQSYISKWEREAEPFFIKNLETVQGDERDCIFISFTYGRDGHGNMYQRFGPINGTNGHRRLNVLFTRAKLRTEVFTSMQPEDILVAPESSRGLKAMRSYLSYAQTGILEQAQVGKGPEPNDFEIAVSSALKDSGLDVHPQVGVAGYFIDLAVCHPQKQGTYILGIECDGATYHSAKSARDRDRLRQSNLENLGWHIHRVWSTDWLRNRKTEVDRIKQRVHNLVRAEKFDEAK